MLKKITLTALVLMMLSALAVSAYAQSLQQTIALKEGFNFISFTLKPSDTAQQLMAKYSQVTQIYGYSAAAGSFLTAGDGSLTLFSAGKGYIFKTTAAVSLTVPGSAVEASGDISLKAGFNLVGFPKLPQSIAFTKILEKFPSIKAVYKWSAAAGAYISVSKNASGAVELSDSIDPALAEGQSYFFQAASDTLFNLSAFSVIDPPVIPPAGPSITWAIATSETGMGKRTAFGCVSFNGKIWVIGGYTPPNVQYGDVWSSEDGKSWTQVTSSAGFSPRNSFGCVVFNNKIWVIGGFSSLYPGDPNAHLNDVWSSSDGKSWTKETKAPFYPRRGHACFVHDNQIWVAGGNANATNWIANVSDVWSSPDGVNWTRKSETTPFGAIEGHVGISFNNKMWIIGGMNELWSSADGASWTKDVASTPFGYLLNSCAVVANGKLLITGGALGWSSVSDQIWHSADGIAWGNIQGGFPARRSHGAAVLNGKIYVLLGMAEMTNSEKSDVWIGTVQ